MSKRTWRILQLASWLYELADPELTAVCAESQDKNTLPAVFSEMVFATDRDALVHHTSEVVSALCFDHLVSSSLRCLLRGVLRKHVKDAVVLKEYVALHVSVLLLASWPLSGVSEDCASTLVEYGSLSTGDRKRVA